MEYDSTKNMIKMIFDGKIWIAKLSNASKYE